MIAENHLKLKFEINRILKYSLFEIIVRLNKKIISLVVIKPFFFPFTILLHLLGFRVPNIFTERIGHLALEPDCLVRLKALGRIPSNHRWILLSPRTKTANQHLLCYWSKYFYIVQNPTACFIIRSMGIGSIFRYDIANVIRKCNANQGAYEIYANSTKLINRTLSLSEEDEVWTSNQLTQLGIPINSWFVCLHARERGFSIIDDDIQDYRNHDINNMIDSIREITSRGGWVIRIGDPSMSKLPPLFQMIDYAHHPIKSDRLDLALCAKAKFILGNSSGISLLGTIFGTPCAVTNLLPFSTFWFRRQDLSIPKLLWSSIHKRYLRASEILNTPIANYQYSEQYTKGNIVPVENTPADILTLTKEMLSLIDESDPKYENILTRKKASDFKNQLKCNHYGYGSLANISEGFVELHKNIFCS